MILHEQFYNVSKVAYHFSLSCCADTEVFTVCVRLLVFLISCIFITPIGCTILNFVIKIRVWNRIPPYLFWNMVLHPQFQQSSYHLACLHSKTFSVSASPITQILPPYFFWWFSASSAPSNILLTLFLLQDLSSKPKAILCEGRCNLVVFYLVITGLSRLQVINGFLILYLEKEMAVLK